MIKAHISKDNKQQIISATGDTPELLSDVAILVSGIYTQLRNNDSAAALIFRTGLKNMANDQTGPMWQSLGDQTGIVFQKPEE